MLRSPPDDDELPDCFYKQNHPILITPATQTPTHHLYLSNLDDQKFLRFSIKYLYLFEKSVSADFLKHSLSRALVHYYPLAGRLRTTTTETDQKLEIDCNGEGAVFAEAFMDITAHQFLQLSKKPNKSWRKLLYRLDAQSFLDIPPLVVQVTNLACGGMILCTAINHCVCDGIGSSQFLHAWAHITTEPNLHLPILPFHSRHVLRPRSPPQVSSTHPGYTRNAPTGQHHHTDISHYLQSQPLVPISLTFRAAQILHLKRRLTPSVKCTTFEVLASHTWRCWVRSLDLSPSLNVKLLFSVNVRKKLVPEMPEGYYGNGFVLGCAEGGVKDLIGNNLYHGVKLVQGAKSRLTDDYVRSLIDVMEDKNVKTDLSTSLVISQWARLGLEDLDFGEGRPMHMGPLTSDIYCLFLPVVGDFDAVKVMVSVPEKVHQRFEYHMKDIWIRGENNGDHGEENNEFC